MKRWAILVVFLYLLMLVALTSPLMLVAFYPTVTTSGALAPYFEWAYWAGLGVMVLAQAVMLLVPVEISLGRPAS